VAKAFGIILMLVAMYVGMTLYSDGIEQAFGGIFAPIDGQEIAGTALMEPDPYAASAGDLAPVKAPITQRVRERVQGHIDRGAARNDRY
jgi:hypothetical protein